MARSVVDLDKVQELKSTISSYSCATDSTIASFRQQAMSLLAEMEEKLSELERIKAEKEAALDRCEVRQKQDEDVSCAAEESAYNRACKRWEQCEALVAQARAAIEKFDSYTQSYQSMKQELVNRADSGLTRVEGIVNDYLTDEAPPTTGGPINGGMGNGQMNPNDHRLGAGSGAPGVGAAGAPGTSGSGTGNGSDMSGGPADTMMSGEEPPSAIYFTGGDQIAKVLPPGSITDPVVLDPDAMVNKFDGLPPVTEVSHDDVCLAASGILSMLAAGGAAIGMRQMLLRQKTDELFEKQYGISSTELLLRTGPKQKEYIAAYNNIYKGLQLEMKDQMKKEISDKITTARNRIKVLSSAEKRMHNIEALHDAKIHLENYENQLTALDDGKKVRPRSLEKTIVGGLSNDSLSYMLDGMRNSKRFITSCNLIADSGAKFLFDHGTYYQFAINEEHFVEVAHDGSWVTHIFADKSKGGNIDFVPKADFETSTTEFGYEYKPFEYKDEGFRYSYKKYIVADDGSATVLGYNSRIGLEASAGAGINVSLHNIEGGASAGISIASGGVKIGDLSAPQFSKGKYVQKEFGIKGEVGLSASLGFDKYKSEDGTSVLGVKAGPFSGGISLGKYTIPAKTFDASLRNKLQ